MPTVKNQQEVGQLLGLGAKYCSNRCRDLAKYYGVIATPENIGRQVVYRLTSPSHSHALVPNLLPFLFKFPHS